MDYLKPKLCHGVRRRAYKSSLALIGGVTCGASSRKPKILLSGVVLSNFLKLYGINISMEIGAKKNQLESVFVK